MNNFFNFIDKYKFGIIAAFATYIGIFMYLQLTSIPEYFEIKPFTEGARLEKPKEEVALKPENIEVPPQFEAGKVTNTARDMNDNRSRSEEDWTATKSTSEDVEKMVREEERKMFEETGGAAKRKAIQQMDEERKKNEKNKSNTPVKSTNSQTGSNNAVKGNVMVEWSLQNRMPHQNNEWNVRNPGYTCGHGSTGRVVIVIKVGQDGRVVSASAEASGSSTANSCMIEQALKYAKLSRFDYSPTEVNQSGKIYYTFISQ
jgi:hypothetical protein